MTQKTKKCDYLKESLGKAECKTVDDWTKCPKASKQCRVTMSCWKVKVMQDG